ncbi:MAG TPA: glycosyltransferase [Segeticoccus sp.]|jgi:MGT family glycosyltransferase|nr:glycosyltransferase [Segeticoccus sp.]
MTRYLAYTPMAAGHLFPLVLGLTELRARGHQVVVVTHPDLVDTLRAVGLDAQPIGPELVARKREATAQGRPDTIEAQIARARLELDDLRTAVSQHRPDALLIDVNTHGANVAAELTGLPWAVTMPSLLPYPGPGIPPYSLGMAPRHDVVGRIRDAVLWKLVERGFARAILPGVNALRAEHGLAAHRTPYGPMLAGDLLLVLTDPPLEYARTSLPASVRMVGVQPWDPPAETPEWLLAPGDPWVLVTCSTDYLADERLAATAVQALRDEPVRVLVTLADAYDGARLDGAPNVRVERFLPHAAVLPHVSAVVCPSGMGVVSKSLAAGVPVVAVPFERDQPEVARRAQQAGAGVVLPAKRLSVDRLRDAVARARQLNVPSVDLSDNPRRFADAVEELGHSPGPGAAADDVAASPPERLSGDAACSGP